MILAFYWFDETFQTCFLLFQGQTICKNAIFEILKIMKNRKTDSLLLESILY